MPAKKANARNAVIVPGQANPEPQAKPAEPDFLIFPEEKQTASQPATQDSQDTNPDELWLLRHRHGTQEPEPLPERKLPWLIDILLYPINVPSLTIIGIVIGVPLIFRIIGWFLNAASVIFAPLLVFAAFVIIVGILARILFALYFLWYFTACIRDSAEGSIRAPETQAITPGLGELFLLLIRLIFWLSFCLTPAIFYYVRTDQTDLPFKLFLAVGILLYPMGLLAVVMFESTRGLNPVLLVRSIFKTFFIYIPLACVYYALIYASAMIINLIPPDILPRYWPWLFLLQAVSMYIAMIAGHLLGRFYFRYQEKLNWVI